MTENDVIAKFKRTSVLWESATNTEMVEAVKAAIQALEEIQQYRAIGTVEEFKALKEKNEPKKIIDIKKSECPEDIEYFGSDELFGKCPHCEGMVNHTWNPCSCGDCGGLIDWSE